MCNYTNGTRICFRVKITVVKDYQVSVTINESISVMMMLHRVWKKHPINVDFLGLYLPNDNQYSSQAHGLIGGPPVRLFHDTGLEHHVHVMLQEPSLLTEHFVCVCVLSGQFAREPAVKVYNLHQGADPLKKEATMEVKGNKLAVTR